MTTQIKALDVLVNLDSLKIWNPGIWITENPEEPESRSGNPGKKNRKSGKMHIVQRGVGASQKAAEGRILASDNKK